MDTGKLLKIIADIQTEEESGTIQARLQNIVNYYDQEDANSINTEKLAIKDTVTRSRLSQYALSDYRALLVLDVNELFGPGLYQKLHDILSSQAHEVRSLLQKLVTDRASALESLVQLQKNLTDFGFESRALSDHDYEIGFTLPENYLDLEKTEEVLNDFRLFLNALANSIGEQQPLRIKYVSNGSIEFFIDAGLKLAEHFDIVLDYMLKIYGSIKAFTDIKKKCKNFAKKRRQQAEKIADEEQAEQVDKLLNELINKLKLPNADDKNRVQKLFLNVLQHIEQGVSAEVHTPQIEPPPEPSADASAEEQKEYSQAKQLYEKKSEIDARNRDIFILQQNNFYGMNTKFLNSREVEESTEEKGEE